MVWSFPKKPIASIKKTEIKLDINLLSRTNKYKTKQTNRKKKYQKEKKPNMNAPFINLTNKQTNIFYTTLFGVFKMFWYDMSQTCPYEIRSHGLV